MLAFGRASTQQTQDASFELNIAQRETAVHGISSTLTDFHQPRSTCEGAGILAERQSGRPGQEYGRCIIQTAGLCSRVYQNDQTRNGETAPPKKTRTSNRVCLPRTTREARHKKKLLLEIAAQSNQQRHARDDANDTADSRRSVDRTRPNNTKPRASPVSSLTR